MFHELILELQANCNRDCFFCPRHSDESGHRKDAEGGHVKTAMSTENVMKILVGAQEMGYRGWITFHHLSEPFLDKRIIDIARTARALGMTPFEHTNGDVLRTDPELCAQAREVFEYIVVGLYDHKTEAEREEEEAFWRMQLGETVRFNAVDTVFVRGHHTEKNLDGFVELRGKRPVPPTYPTGACNRPLHRMMIHYTGKVALCCEDMCEDFELGNAFKQPLKEIRYSEEHVTVVRDLQEGNRAKYPLCAGCPMPPT